MSERLVNFKIVINAVEFNPSKRVRTVPNRPGHFGHALRCNLRENQQPLRVQTQNRALFPRVHHRLQNFLPAPRRLSHQPNPAHLHRLQYPGHAQRRLPRSDGLLRHVLVRTALESGLLQRCSGQAGAQHPPPHRQKRHLLDPGLPSHRLPLCSSILLYLFASDASSPLLSQPISQLQLGKVY